MSVSGRNTRRVMDEGARQFEARLVFGGRAVSYQSVQSEKRAPVVAADSVELATDPAVAP